MGSTLFAAPILDDDVVPAAGANGSNTMQANSVKERS